MPTNLFLAIFGLYITALVVLSWWVSRKQDSGEDYLLGNRQVPFLLILGTTVATLVGTGSSMGAVGLGYQAGWAGSMYGLGGGIGTLMLAYLFASARKLEFMTFSEEISYYYGANRTIKGLVGLLILLASVGWLGAHILGGGLYLSWITSMDLLTSKILVASGFGIYVIIGGYLAVVWTDSIQAIILFTGFILLAVISWDKVGGLQGLEQVSSSGHLGFLQGENLIPSISLAVVIGIGVIATPAYRQRIYSSDSERTIKRSFYLSGTLYLFFSFIPALVGMAAQHLNPGLENANYAFPFMATEVLPLWLGMTVLIAGLSATMSSASSDAIAGVSILLRDVFILFTGRMPAREKAMRYSRWGVFFIVTLALIFTLFATDIIDYIKYMISIIMSGMFVCVMMGKYWPRANWQGGLATLVGGAAASIIIMYVPHWDAYWGNPVIPSMVISALAGIVVSLLTPPNKVSAEVAAQILADERHQMESV